MADSRMNQVAKWCDDLLRPALGGTGILGNKDRFGWWKNCKDHWEKRYDMATLEENPAWRCCILFDLCSSSCSI